MLQFSYSHSLNGIMATRSPRKRPSQSRSIATVEAIFDATIQVLLSTGLERLTTTKVADRAGVSVGTLYQYFPNKEVLLRAVLERHLLRVVEIVESACASAHGQPMTTMVDAVVDAFFMAKLENKPASRALYAVSSELGGETIVGRSIARSERAIVDMLRSASDCHFENPAMVGFIASSAVVTPVQALLASKASTAEFEAVRLQLKTMIAAYLNEARRASN